MPKTTSSPKPLVIGFCTMVLTDGVGDIQHLLDIITAFVEHTNRNPAFPQYNLVIMLHHVKQASAAVHKKMVELNHFMKDKELTYTLAIDIARQEKDRSALISNINILFQVSTFYYIHDKPRLFSHLKPNCTVINIGELTSTNLITEASRQPPAFAAHAKDDFNFNFGLGPKGYGIKIRPFIDSNHELFSQLSKPLQKLFTQRSDTQKYDPEKQLIFPGYFKSDEVGATFIATILTSSFMQDALTNKQMFFFVNLHTFEAKALSAFLLKAWGLDVEVTILHTKNQNKKNTSSPTSKAIKIYVISEYIDLDEDHRTLYALAHHIVGCCGDNSFELAMSAKKFPWFEVRDCKAYTWMEFLLLCQHYGASASLIDLFSRLQFRGFGSKPPSVRSHLYINGISENEQQRHIIDTSKHVAPLLTQRHIDEFCKQILPYIHSHHNFYDALPEILQKTFLWHAYPEQRMIPIIQDSLMDRYKNVRGSIIGGSIALLFFIYRAILHNSLIMATFAAFTFLAVGTLYYRQSLVSIADLGKFPRDISPAIPSSSSSGPVQLNLGHNPQTLLADTTTIDTQTTGKPDDYVIAAAATSSSSTLTPTPPSEDQRCFAPTQT